VLRLDGSAFALRASPRHRARARSSSARAEADGRRCAKHNGKDARTNRDVTNGQPSDSFRSLSAFAMTETELKVIAALAIIGLNSSPDQGYRMPAATGTPATL
jgi:hypothetical protein